MATEPEIRKCGDCGEEWIDTGDEECPFCGSHNTAIPLIASFRCVVYQTR